MKTRSDLFYSDGRLCLKLTDDTKSLRGYEAPQNKVPAMLYKDNQVIDIPWQSVIATDNACTLSFMPSVHLTEIPYTVADLPNELKPRAIEILETLSHAMEMCDSKLDWNLGAIPTSSIYFFKDGSILLLSKQISEIIDRFEYDDERFRDKEMWYAHNTVNDFGKAHFLFQLLYYALTGIAPFEDQDIRLTGFIPVPMQLYFAKGNTKIAALSNEVNKAFSQNKKLMYQIKAPYEHFRKVLQSTTEDLTPEDIAPQDNPDLPLYKENQAKKAQRRTFWRTKGLITTIIAIAAAVVIYIAAYYIHLATKAPETKDLNEVQMIEHYYDAYTRLDVQAMEEPLKYGYNSPDTTNIATRYVTSTMQQAYEGASMTLDARQWVSAGLPSIPQSYTVFGVTSISVTQLDDDVFDATITLYDREDMLGISENIDLTFTEQSDSTLIYKYKATVRFTFRSRKTWREITNIETTNVELLDVYEVPYTANDTTSAAIMALSVLNMFPTL